MLREVVKKFITMSQDEISATLYRLRDLIDEPSKPIPAGSDHAIRWMDIQAANHHRRYKRCIEQKDFDTAADEAWLTVYYRDQTCIMHNIKNVC